MPTDTAITRLLYAMLSQKCLKDIDWNIVANDPVLSQEITNGHAARMRYSRFKKQMDGNTTTTTRKPRKNKISKTSAASSSKPKPPKRSNEESEQDHQHQVPKLERDVAGPILNPGESFNSQSTSSSARDMQTPDPEPGLNMHTGGSGHVSRFMKPEPGLQAPTYQPTTPLTSFSTPNYTGRYAAASMSPSPNTSFNQDMVYSSFGDPGMMGVGNGNCLYGEMIGGENAFVYGMGSPTGGNLSYEDGLWHQHGHGHGNSSNRHVQEIVGGEIRREGENVSVKSEPRWE